MLPFPLPRIFDTVYCDDQGLVKAKDQDSKSKSKTLNAISSLKQVVGTPEPELKRWRRTFDAFAKVAAVGDEK